MAAIYNDLGTIGNAQSDYVSAAGYYNNSLKIALALKDYYNVAVACENLSLVYQYQEDYKKGIDYARKSISSYKLYKYERGTVGPLAMLGDLFLRIKKYDSSFHYYQVAITVAKRTNELLKLGALMNSLASYYASQKDWANAIKTALKGKNIYDGFGSNYEDAINNKGLLGSYYLQQYKSIGSIKSDSAKKIIKLIKVLFGICCL